MPRLTRDAAGKWTLTLVLVDLFCGAGGLSEAAKESVDRLRAKYPHVEIVVVHYAINCWDVAIKTLALNHPGAIAICQRVEFVKPSQLVVEGWIDLLTAGVECIYHSNARGDKPINDQRRSTAWVVPDWLQVPTVAYVLECVREIRGWGPLDAKGKKIKALKGNIYRAWIEAIRAHGFLTAEEDLCCADFGDPTTRERWFSLGRSDGRTISFPEPSHASPAKLAKLTQSAGLFGAELAPWRTARNDVIDWTKKGKTVFRRSARNADTTLTRIEVGLRKFNDARALPWVVAIQHFMGKLPEIGPLPLVEFKGDKSEVQPVVVVLRNHGTAESIDSPLPTLCADGRHFWLADPVLVKYYKTGDAQSVDDPLATVTTRDRFAVAEPMILPHPRTSEPERVESVDKPLTTITATSCDFAMAEPMMIGQGGPEYAAKPRSIDDPVSTVMCANHAAVVTPIVVNMKGQSTASDVDAPIPTQTTENHFYVAEGFLLPHRKIGKMDVDSLDRPVRTLDATNCGQTRHVEPILVPNFGENKGQKPRSHSVDDPTPTICAQHGGPNLIQGYLIDVNHGIRPGESQDRRAQSLDDPVGTITAERRGKAVVDVEHIELAEESLILLPVLIGHGRDGNEQYRYFLYTVSGAYLGEIDITLRMLEWMELARATSLEEYRFCGTKSDITKQIGNAVPRRTGLALCYSQLEPTVDDALRGLPVLEEAAA